MNINQELNKLYHVEYENVCIKKGCWDICRCTVFCGNEKIGSYDYNYHCKPPFHAFEKDGKHYALYSTHYTATRVMSLPDCKDLGGEEPHGFGFCPVNFAVPYGTYEVDMDDGSVVRKQFNAEFGFSCGCIWGDDYSWKIEYLDLSRVAEGIIVRDGRLGYVELLGTRDTLADAIDVEHWQPDNQLIYIACRNAFVLNK